VQFQLVSDIKQNVAELNEVLFRDGISAKFMTRYKKDSSCKIEAILNFNDAVLRK
jgi:hypothetical protein